MALQDCYTLSNGVKIPCVGFGTWQAPNGEVAEAAVLSALAAGYRHIDTAEAYRNEESVGRAIAKSGIAREELFLTSKLNTSEHGYERTMAAFHESLRKLGTDYLDLFLVHWPNPIQFRDCWQQANAGTWKAFEELYAAGRIRAIGVSNFRAHHLDALMQTATVAPMINQIRICPGDTPADQIADSRARGMLLEAYSPLGTGKIFSVPLVQSLAEKYNRTVAQICVRYSLQMGFLPLPKSVTAARIAENADVFDFELTQADVQSLANLRDVVGYAPDPDEITW